MTASAARTVAKVSPAPTDRAPEGPAKAARTTTAPAKATRRTAEPDFDIPPTTFAPARRRAVAGQLRKGRRGVVTRGALASRSRGPARRGAGRRGGRADRSHL